MQMLRDYVAFVNCLQVKDVRKKVESELGRKMVVLRMVLSVDDFSSQVAPIAGDHIFVDSKKPQ